ncbi:MAG: hypothetical protein WD967_01770 [Candidatus Levyibacteriota bacterium]
MRKVALLTLFFFIPPILLLTSAFYLYYLAGRSHQMTTLTASNHSIAYAALPSAENNLTGEVVQKDARVEIVKSFFGDYKSPLEPYAQNVVASADKYDLDFRLLPAIAMQESNLCKKTPKDSNNCWGFGIYGKKVTTFDDYGQAIETVSKVLARDYVNRGLKTPEEIQSKYTPSNTGSWAFAVNHFMNVLSLTPQDPETESDSS